MFNVIWYTHFEKISHQCILYVKHISIGRIKCCMEGLRHNALGEFQRFFYTAEFLRELFQFILPHHPKTKTLLKHLLLKPSKWHVTSFLLIICASKWSLTSCTLLEAMRNKLILLLKCLRWNIKMRFLITEYICSIIPFSWIGLCQVYDFIKIFFSVLFENTSFKYEFI